MCRNYRITKDDFEQPEEICMKIIKDITYDCLDVCKLDLYLPESNKFPLLVFFHGGGLVSEDKSTDMHLYEYLASNGIAVAAANYRKYPSAKYPEFIEDAASAVYWAHRKIKNYGICKNIYIAGSSAGAYLSMMLCFDKTYLGKHRINPNDIAGYIFDSAQPTTHFSILKERGINQRKVVIDDAAPIYHIGEVKIKSPIMIIIAEHDIPNRLEQTLLFCSTLKLFGYDEKKLTFKIMKGYRHLGYTNAFDANGNSVFGEVILDFIRNLEGEK
jgi:dipeptidyl aminopeptidase/acylaminoacyl peptidase